MTIQHLGKAFQLIEDNIKECNFEKEPKSEILIQKAEQALGLQFPPTYRSFLKRYGCGGMHSMEIYGLIDDDFYNSAVPDSIWTTLHDRKQGYIPNHFIHIADTGDGFYYYLDALQIDNKGEYPVVIWGRGLKECQKEKVAEDFGEFLLQQVQQALNEDEE